MEKIDAISLQNPHSHVIMFLKYIAALNIYVIGDVSEAMACETTTSHRATA